MKTLIISILILLPSLGYAEWKNWHPVNETLFKSFVLLNVVDTMQTFDLIDCQNKLGKECPFHESNLLIGPRPSKEEVLIVKTLLVGGAYYLLNKSYPTPLWKNSNKPKFVALVIMNMVYIDTVSKNKSIGLRLSYKF
tara:strand:+ start:532 stop:945 length:414 start_codon:yes stop_codon:yes gene_type:complete